MKEWEFDKNIPAKEMRFMAAKARKREIEEGKLTAFYRHGTLVDHDKVESFKKQKLNAKQVQGQFVPREYIAKSMLRNPLISVETPANISYETPRPVSSDDDVTALSAKELEDHTADHGEVFAKNVNCDSAKNISLPSRSADYDSLHLSEESIQPPLDPIDGIYALGRDNWTVEWLKEDVTFIGQEFEHGKLLSNAVLAYNNIRKYIDRSGGTNDPVLKRLATELGGTLSNCYKVIIPATALINLRLLEDLDQASLAGLVVHLILLDALETLLRTDSDIRNKDLGDIHQVVWALKDWHLSPFLRPALRAYFKQRHQQLEASQRLEDNHGFDLIALACMLNVLFRERHGWYSASTRRTTSHIHQIVTHLRQNDYLFVDELRILQRIINQDQVNLGDVGSIQLSLSTFYSSVASSVLKLATACSATGWIRQAELFFAVLRSTCSLETFEFKQQNEIVSEYYLHLERCNEIVSTLDVADFTLLGGNDIKNGCFQLWGATVHVISEVLCG
jgi:hypothetical protein